MTQIIEIFRLILSFGMESSLPVKVEKTLCDSTSRSDLKHSMVDIEYTHDIISR